MDRKGFIRNSILGAFALTAAGSVIRSEEGTFEGDCATTRDILGPFYRPGSPERSDMLFEGLKGNQILLQGKVYGADCVTPVKNARVEVWHCDTEGNYDNDTEQFRHRAQLQTGRNGGYAFSTIVPGKYLNGRLYRPAHIHFRITAPGHKELVSQIYFQGDPHIEEDPWASHPAATKRILPIFPESTSSALSVKFDIYLQPA